MIALKPGMRRVRNLSSARPVRRGDCACAQFCCRGIGNGDSSHRRLRLSKFSPPGPFFIRACALISKRAWRWCTSERKRGGEGDTKNARERAIGGHPAVFLKWQCRYKNPNSRYADKQGYVPFGRLVNYTGGRSNGCTTWSPSASREILALVEGNPTTLYIYPESSDINAVAKAVKSKRSLSRAGLYWNAACLKAIGTPKFWPKRTLQPIINAWRRSLPKQPPLELPICK